MRSLITLVAAGLVMLAPAASAQEPQQERDPGLWCVYEKLVGSLDYESVAEAYLYDGDTTGDPGGVLAKAANECGGLHKQTAGQREAAIEFGRLGATADYLIEDMMWEGLEEDEVEAIFGAMDSISDDDYDALFAADAIDPAAATRIKDALKAAGYPDDENFLGGALTVMGLVALTDEVQFIYMFDEDSN